MSPDRSPSIPREAPRSRKPFSALVGQDVLLAGGFNEGNPSMGLTFADGRSYELYIGKPAGQGQEQDNIVVGAEVVQRGPVWYRKWFAGTVYGLPRGDRDADGAEEFDLEAGRIVSGSEIPHPELRDSVLSLISEDRLREVMMIPEAPVGQNGRTLHDIVPPEVLESLGYISGRNQGSFMFNLEENPDQIGLAHVFDASGTRPNIVVLEVPTLSGSQQAKDWYAGIIDGKKYGDLEEAEAKANFRGQVLGIRSDYHRVDESGVAGVLAAFV